MNKQGSLIIAVLSFIFALFLTNAFAQAAYIVNKDTFGASSKEDISKMTSVIMAKDQKAFDLMVKEGSAFPVKEGTRVFVEDTAFWEGLVKVRPEGQTNSVWMFNHDLTSESGPAAVESQKSAPSNNGASAYKIEGTVFDKTKPIVMISGRNYSLGDTVAGVKIIGIASDSVIIEKEGKHAILKIGDCL